MNSFAPQLDKNNQTYSKMYYPALYPSVSNITYSDLVNYVNDTAVGYIQVDDSSDSMVISNIDNTAINDTIICNQINTNDIFTNTINTNNLDVVNLTCKSAPIAICPVIIQNSGFSYPLLKLSNNVANLNLDLTQPLYITIQPNYKIIFFYQSQILGYIHNTTDDYLYNQGVVFPNIDYYQIIYIKE